MSEDTGYRDILKAIDKTGRFTMHLARNSPAQRERVGLADEARNLLIRARDLLHAAEMRPGECEWCHRTLPTTAVRRRTCSPRCRVARSRVSAGSTERKAG